MPLEALRVRILSAMGLGLVGCAPEPPPPQAPPPRPEPVDVPTAAAATASVPTASAPTASVPTASLPTASAPSPPLEDAAAPAADAATASAPPGARDAGASKFKRWSATYTIPSRPAYCRTGYATCLSGEIPRALDVKTAPRSIGRSPSLTSCPSEIDMPCECSPHAGCFEDSTCVAPLQVQLSQTERGKHPGACCYAPPQRCVHPAEGRPLVVGGERRRAPAAPRAGFTLGPELDEALAAELDALDPIAREATGARWLARAAGEHASVAAFSRVALHLIAVGAPAELLARTHHAALDEITHARIAYAIATAAAKRPLGPGPLPHAASADAPPPTHAALVRSALRDACYEETAGALALREEAGATPGLVGRLAASIADDEERHAELAWATLAWLVRDGGAAAIAAAESALADLPREDPIVGAIVRPSVEALLRSAREASSAVEPILT